MCTAEDSWRAETDVCCDVQMKVRGGKWKEMFHTLLPPPPSPHFFLCAFIEWLPLFLFTCFSFSLSSLSLSHSSRRTSPPLFSFPPLSPHVSPPPTYCKRIVSVIFVSLRFFTAAQSSSSPLLPSKASGPSPLPAIPPHHPPPHLTHPHTPLPPHSQPFRCSQGSTRTQRGRRGGGRE